MESTLRERNLKGKFYSTVRSTVHTNPSRKRKLLETLFKLEDLKTSSFPKSITSQ